MLLQEDYDVAPPGFDGEGCQHFLDFPEWYAGDGMALAGAMNTLVRSPAIIWTFMRMARATHYSYSCLLVQCSAPLLQRPKTCAGYVTAYSVDCVHRV